MNRIDNDVVISVENVTMAFNLNKEKVDNLKEYVIKLLRRQLEFKKFYALQDINFQVRRGQHLGILGLNGAGKSTLFRCIVGEENFDSGQLMLSQKHTMGYLEQMPQFGEEVTLLDAVLEMFSAETTSRPRIE